MSAPLVPNDLLRVALAADPQCAADGSTFYVRVTFDEESNETRTAIWRVAADGTDAAFTTGRHDREPRVSPDGRTLAFVGDRGEGKRLYTLALSGGEACALGPAYPSIGGLAWSRDSRRLAFVASAQHEPMSARSAHDERTGARHIRALPFKSDDAGLLDGTRRHLFVVGPSNGAEPKRVTSGDFDVSTPDWSADGTRIAFSAQIGMPETAFRTDIYTVATDGSGTPERLTDGSGPFEAPVYSRDGRELAFLGHFKGDDIGGRFNTELLVMPAEGGAIRSLSATLDRPAGDAVICDMRGTHGATLPVWNLDDSELLLLVSNEGSCGVRAFARTGGASRIVVGGERDISSFALGHEGRLAFIASDPLRPSDLFVVEPPAPERRLTDLNPWLAQRALVSPRRLRPRAADGTRLDVFVLEATGPRAPLVLEVHGGPHAAYGFAFFFEFQMLASHGIAVAYGNPRGSQSYGHAYADAITGNWGKVDAADVESMLDAVLADGSYDPQRIGLAGGSYGGFMTTWLLARSRRFAAGVSMRAVNDFVSEAGASDFGWFLENEVGAPWGSDGRELFERSPMRAASAIETPLLIEHSERDYRCPIDQGEQLFTLLRRLGKTAEFVRFTGDGHDLSRTGNPRNRILRLRAIAHWFIRFLQPPGITPAPDQAGALFAPLPTEAGPGTEAQA